MPSTLLKRCTCPHCWRTFSPEDVLWVATHPDLFRDPLLGDEYRRFLPSRFTLGGDALDARGQVCMELACPHCHLAIPRSILEVDPFFVSILGTPSCGKSVFLAAMTWELRKFLPAHFRMSFADADARANMLLSTYQQSMFMNEDDEQIIPMLDLIPKTEQTGDLYNIVNYDGKITRYPKPFFFAMAPSKDHPSIKDAARISRMVCLYDNAGENYLTGAKGGQNTETQHLGKAQFLMYLFDPTQDQRYLKKLQASGRRIVPDPRNKLQRQETVLIEATDRVRKLTGMGSTMKYERPLIVVVTKLDDWEELLPPDRDKTSVWGKRDDGMFTLDLSGVEVQSKLIRELLLQITPEVVTSAESFADRVTYIGVSALGTTPQPIPPDSPKFNPAQPHLRGIRPVDIQPRNVVLPFIYGLGHSLSGPISMNIRKKR